MALFIALTVLSGLLSFGLTAVVRHHALRNDVLDHPNERSSHVSPTPHGGGLAILIGAGLAVLIAASLSAISIADARTIGVGVLVLGLVGWLDDHKGLPPSIRFGAQLLVAVWTMVGFGGLASLQAGQATIPLGAFGFVLGAVGIVWSINLFNFMDGIDGLAGSQAVLIFGTCAALLLSRGNQSLGLMAAIVAAACGGFLVWNWAPARIFMGDVGSGPIGYLIASVAIASEDQHAVPLLVFAILGGVFIFDATATLLRRIARGERPADPHRSHAYQRLARRWGTHSSVSLAAAGLTIALCALGSAAVLVTNILAACVAVAYGLLGALYFAIERREPMVGRTQVQSN